MHPHLRSLVWPLSGDFLDSNYGRQPAHEQRCHGAEVWPLDTFAPVASVGRSLFHAPFKILWKEQATGGLWF